MTPRWHLAWWLAVVVAGVVAIAIAPVRADLSALLPRAPTAGSQVLIEQLRNGATGRLILAAVAGGDPQQRAEAVRGLAAALADDARIAAVEFGGDAGRRALQAFVFEHRYLLSPAVATERFGAPGLRAAIEATLADVAGTTGLISASLLARDPTGEAQQLVATLAGRDPPPTRAGVWSSRDGTRALLLIRLNVPALDSAAQEAALADIRARFAALAPTPLRLSLSGPPVFAVESRVRIQGEVGQLAALAFGLVFAVLWWAYRSPRLLALGLLPVATATLAGFAAVALVFGSVHGLTLAFGVTMIGEAVDYPIYYLLAADRRAPSWAERQWPLIRLGLLTSLAGLSALLLSDFPGLSQLGLFCIVGLVTAALVTRHVLPLWAGAVPAAGASPAVQRRLDAWADRAVRWRWPLTALAIACALLPWLRPTPLWGGSLESLSPVAAADRQFDAELRADLGLADARLLVAVPAASAEQALQGAERAGAALDRLATAGAIGGFDSPARWLPSMATQRQRLAALPETAELQRRLRLAVDGLPIRAEGLAGFVADVERARRRGPLRAADLAGTPLALAVDATLVPAAGSTASSWWALLPLYPVRGGAAPEAARVNDALRDGGVDGAIQAIDLKRQVQQIYDAYFAETRQWVAAGAAAIVVLLAWRLRSVGAVLRVLRPLLLGGAAVLGVLGYAVGPLGLLHLIALLLVAAVGSNYALLLAAPSTAAAAPRLPVGLLVAAVTTVLSFAVLTASSVPALAAIGSTVAPGVVAVLICAVAWQARR